MGRISPSHRAKKDMLREMQTPPYSKTLMYHAFSTQAATINLMEVWVGAVAKPFGILRWRRPVKELKP